VKDRRRDASTVTKLRSDLAQLRRSVERLEAERDRRIKRRRRELLLIGVAISMVVHIGLLISLGLLYRDRPGGVASEPVMLEFATLQEQDLTELDRPDLSDLVPEIVPDFEQLPALESPATLDAEIPAAELRITAEGATPTLGGAGSGEGVAGLDGGGAGTSFFGVASAGTRFAYIVDVSGSMGQHRKLGIAMRELARSIESLPDFASFYVVLFSSDFIEPPMQRGWTKARPETIRFLIRWLNDVDPGGGTEPRNAFHQVFALSERPDVIFFLTDGRIGNFSAEEVAALNRGGDRVIVNTIAFGDPASQDLLRQIAADSGGVYRFVPTEGG
jgi:hypothetical protein